jgi:two-component system, NtrC family, response regulator AtoC
VRRPVIHILDDDADFGKLVAANLGRRGEFKIRLFSDPELFLSEYDNQLPDAVITDLLMPGMDGIEVTRRLRARAGHLPIFLLTGHGEVRSAIEALKAGANEYLLKPPNVTELTTLLRRALEQRPLIEDAVALKERNKARFTTRAFVGRHPLVEETRRFVGRVAAVPRATVILLGESGTGKNLVARTIHFESAEADRRFVEVNCSAMPAQLLESELFGFMKGAFTGATESKRGLIEVADGGTLFLDEIGDLTAETQAKLLNFLESRRFRRLGGTEEIEVGVRVITATNRDLAALVAEGKFRQDLYYRINVAAHRLPALREIRSDIPELVEHFRAHFNTEFAKEIQGISPDTLGVLSRWDWPGNVRELRNVVERAMIFASGPLLELEDLPHLQERQPRPEDPDTGDGFRLAPGLTLELAEKEYIRQALVHFGDDIQRTADTLGISRKNLWEKRKRHGLLS